MGARLANYRTLEAETTGSGAGRQKKEVVYQVKSKPPIHRKPSMPAPNSLLHSTVISQPGPLLCLNNSSYAHASTFNPSCPSSTPHQICIFQGPSHSQTPSQFFLSRIHNVVSCTSTYILENLILFRCPALQHHIAFQFSLTIRLLTARIELRRQAQSPRVMLWGISTSNTGRVPPPHRIAEQGDQYSH
jgi:hypothetical protein